MLTSKKFTVAALSLVLLTGTAGNISAQEKEGGSSSASTAEAEASANASVSIQQQAMNTIMAELEATGYQVIEVSTTFLGRIRILASNSENMREIVVSRSTGEVKRDVIVEVFATGSGSGSVTAQDGTESASDDGDLSINVDTGVDLNIGSESSDSSNTGSAGGSLSGSVGLGIGN